MYGGGPCTFVAIFPDYRTADRATLPHVTQISAAAFDWAQLLISLLILAALAMVVSILKDVAAMLRFNFLGSDTPLDPPAKPAEEKP